MNINFYLKNGVNSESMTRKKLLLMMPLEFYSMSKQLSEALKEIGYDEVVCVDQRYPSNLVAKIKCKLKWMDGIYRNTYDHIDAVLNEHGYFDTCLIIKGYGVTPRLVERMKLSCRRVIGYNFDSFSYHPLSLTWYKCVDKFYTFDFKDAKERNLEIVELYSAIKNCYETKEKKYDLSTIQRVHSDRLLFLDKVLKKAKTDKLFIYLYESDYVTAFLNFIKHPVLYIRYKKYIHFKSLHFDRYIDALQNAVCTIDFAHPLQTGATIRCYEAASMGTKVITNNGYVKESKVLPINNMILFNENTFDKDYSELLSRPIEVKNRSITDFVLELTKEF